MIEILLGVIAIQVAFGVWLILSIDVNLATWINFDMKQRKDTRPKITERA